MTTRPATDAERIAIVGSRAHPNLDLVRAYVRSLPPGTVVVSGGAEGVDACTYNAAIACGLEAIIFHPVTQEVTAWRDVVWRGAYSSGAEPIGIAHSKRDALLFRNTLIAIHCDRMVVFPDGSKGGCWDAAREAVRFKRPVEVRWCNGEVQPFGKSMQKRIAAQVER